MPDSYDDVLLPTDAGPLSRAAAEHAVAVAARHDATLHALYVIDTETSWLAVSKSEVKSALRDVGEKESEAALEAVHDVAEDEGVDVVSVVREGSPDTEILTYATETDVDHVVMGTHGRDGIERHLLGSVAERVVRESPVPVTTVSATAADR